MPGESLPAEDPEPSDAVLQPIAVYEELVRVGTPLGNHRHRLAAPDQFRAAQPEPPPAPASQVARAAVPIPVPSLHRVDREPVARLAAEQGERLR